MRLRNILLAVGVTALLAGASLAALWMFQRPAIEAAQPPGGGAGVPAPIAQPQATKAVLVAAHKIVSGTLLRAEDVTWKDVPASGVAPEQIAREAGGDDRYLGALVKTEIAQGEPVVTGALIKPSDRGFLAALLHPGMRAVSIAVEATQSAAGLLLPDNRIDIILTQTFAEDSEPTRKSVGETILKDIRVIAVDQRLGHELPPEKTTGLEGSMPKTITLEVTEREAETLVVASRIGRLDVSLRALGVNGEEEEAIVAKPVTAVWAVDVSPALKSIRRASLVAAPAAPAPAPAAQPERPRQILEVMHGPKIETR